MADKESDLIVSRKVTAAPKADGVDVHAHVYLDVATINIDTVIDKIGKTTASSLKNALDQINKAVSEVKNKSIGTPVYAGDKFTKATLDEKTGKYHYDTVATEAHAFSAYLKDGTRQVMAAVKNAEGSFEVYDFISGIKVIDGYFKDIGEAIRKASEAARFRGEAGKDKFPVDRRVLVERLASIEQAYSDTPVQVKENAVKKASKRKKANDKNGEVVTTKVEQTAEVAEADAKSAQETADRISAASKKKEEANKKEAEAKEEAAKQAQESAKHAQETAKQTQEAVKQSEESTKAKDKIARSTSVSKGAVSGEGLTNDIGVRFNASNLDELFKQIQDYFDDRVVDVKFGSGNSKNDMSVLPTNGIGRQNMAMSIYNNGNQIKDYIDAYYDRVLGSYTIPTTNDHTEEFNRTVREWVNKRVEDYSKAITDGASSGLQEESANDAHIKLLESEAMNLSKRILTLLSVAIKKGLSDENGSFTMSDATSVKNMGRRFLYSDKNPSAKDALKSSIESGELDKGLTTALSVIQRIFNEESMGNIGRSLVASIMRAFSASVQEFAEASKSVGEGVSTGLAEGIASSSADAKDASTQMSNEVIDSAKKALEVHSPSRKFIEIGKNVVDGLRQGLANMPDEIDKTIKQLESRLKAAESRANNASLSADSRAAGAKMAQTLRDNLLLMQSVKYISDNYDHANGTFINKGGTWSKLEKEADRLSGYHGYLNDNEDHKTYETYIEDLKEIERAKQKVSETPIISDAEKDRVEETASMLDLYFGGSSAIGGEIKPGASVYNNPIYEAEGMQEYLNSMGGAVDLTEEQIRELGILNEQQEEQTLRLRDYDDTLIRLKADLDSYYSERAKYERGNASNETIENYTEIRNRLKEILGLTAMSDESFDAAFLNPDRVREYVDNLNGVRIGQQDASRLNNIIFQGVNKVRSAIKGAREAQDAHTDSISKTQKKTSELSRAYTSMYTQLTNGLRQISGIFTGLVGGFSLNTIVQNVETLDKAVVDLQVATGYSRKETQELVESYSDFANEMGVTTSEIASAADGWLRQGYAIEKVNDLIKASIKLAKLGKISSEDAQKSITATLKGYEKEADFAESIVDKLTSVDMAAAINAGEIATGLSKVAPMAKTLGVDVDNLVGYVAQVGQTMQITGDVAGTALKSIFGRMAQIKTGKIGEAIVDPETAEDISNVDTTLSLLGVHLRDDKGNFRDFDDVLRETAKLWDELSKKGDTTRQAAIANALGGTRMRPYVDALLNGYAEAIKLSEISANSAGTSEEKYQAYLESTEAAINRVKSAYENLSQTILSSDFLATLFNGFSNVITVIDTVSEKVGGLYVVLSAFLASSTLKMLNTVFSGAIFSGAGVGGAFLAILPVLKYIAIAALAIGAIVGGASLINKAQENSLDWESHSDAAKDAETQEKSLESQLDATKIKIQELQEEGQKTGFNKNINEQITLLLQEKKALEETIAKAKELNEQELEAARNAAEKSVDKAFIDTGVANELGFETFAKGYEKINSVRNKANSSSFLHMSFRDPEDLFSGNSTIYDILTGNDSVDVYNIEEVRALLDILGEWMDAEYVEDLYENGGNANRSSINALLDILDWYSIAIEGVGQTDEKVKSIYDKFSAIRNGDQYELLGDEYKAIVDNILNNVIFDQFREAVEEAVEDAVDNVPEEPDSIKTYEWKKTLSNKVKTADEIKQEDALAGVISVLEAEVKSVEGLDDIMVGKINPNLAEHVSIISKNDDALQRYINDWQNGVITSKEFLEILKNAQNYSLYGNGSTAWDRALGELESFLPRINDVNEQINNMPEPPKLSDFISKYIQKYGIDEGFGEYLDYNVHGDAGGTYRDFINGGYGFKAFENGLVSKYDVSMLAKIFGMDALTAEFDEDVIWKDYIWPFIQGIRNAESRAESEFEKALNDYDSSYEALVKKRSGILQPFSDSTVKELLSKYPELTHDIVEFNNAVVTSSSGIEEYNRLMEHLKLLADNAVVGEISSRLNSFMNINDQQSFSAWMIGMENMLATTGKWKSDDIVAFMSVFTEMADLSKTSKQDALTKLKELAEKRPDWEPWIKFFETLFEFEKDHTQYETAFKAIQDFFNSSTPGEKANAIEELNTQLDELYGVDDDTRNSINDILSAATTPEQKQSALAQMLDILTKLGNVKLNDLIEQTKEFMSLNDTAAMERSGARSVESALSSYLNDTRNVIDREDVVVNLKKALLETHQFGETMAEIDELFNEGGLFYDLANSKDFSAGSKLNIVQRIIDGFAANGNTADWAPVFESMMVSFDAEAKKRSGASNIASALSTFLGVKNIGQAKEVSTQIMQTLFNDFEFTQGQAEDIMDRIFAGLVHEGSYNRERNVDVLKAILGSIFNGDTQYSMFSYLFDDLAKEMADPTVWQNYTSPLETFFSADNSDDKAKAWGEFLDQLKQTENIDDELFQEISDLGTLPLNRNSLIAMLISLLSMLDGVNPNVLRELQKMRLTEGEQTRSDAEKKLEEYGLGGNVDLLNRPRVMFTQAKGIPIGDWATVATETFTDENGTIAVNFTPYIVDENGNYVGYLSSDQLRAYAEGVISGAHSDYYNLQIGSWFTGEDALERAERVAEDIHEAQEAYYQQISDQASEFTAYNSAYANRQMYGIADYSPDMMGLFGSIYGGQTTSLSPEQVDMLLEKFPQLNDEIKQFNDGTMSATEFWNELAKAISSTNFEEGSKSLSELMDVIKNSTKNSYKYAEAVESISDIFGDFIDEKDVPGYFDEIQSMLKGDQGAFEELQQAVAEGLESKWELDPGGLMQGLWTVQGLAEVLGVEADELAEKLMGLGLFTTKKMDMSGYIKYVTGLGGDLSKLGIKTEDLGGELDVIVPTDENPLKGKHRGGGGGKKGGSGGKKSVLSEQYTNDKGMYDVLIDNLKSLNNLYEEGSEEWLRNQQRIIETYQAYAKTTQDEYNRLVKAGVDMTDKEMQTLAKDLIKINNEIYEASRDYWEAVRENTKKSMEHIVDQMDAVLDLRDAHKDLLKEIRQENRELEKQYKIAQDEAAHPGLTEAEREMLFSTEDYKRLTGMLKDISEQADALYEEYRNKISSVTEDETYAISYITDEYERQLGLLESQYEIAKQQLAVEKARQELQNTLRERNTAVLINGAWTWMADPDAVQAAMEKVADAEVELEDAITDADYNRETAEIETARDAIKSSIDAMEALEFAIEDLADGIVDLTDAINERIFNAIGTTSRNYLNQTKGHGLDHFINELTELQETSGLVFSNSDVEKLYSLLSSGNVINSANVFDDSIVHDSAAIASILSNTSNNTTNGGNVIYINGIQLSDADSEMLLNALDRVAYTWQA